MIEVYHKRKWYRCPQSWAELTGKQLVAVMAVLYGTDDIATGRVKLHRILLGWNWWTFVTTLGLHRLANIGGIKHFGKRFMVKAGRWLDNTERLASSANEITAFLFEKATLTKNLLPKIGKLYGPDSELMNVKMKEFCYAEYHFLTWKTTQAISDLNQLCATLYRPAKKGYDIERNEEGDIRIDFNNNATQKRSELVDKWPLPVKLAVASFYQSCREKKIEENEPVFKEGDGEAATFGLWSVMRSVAKNGTFGDFEKVENTYVDTVLMDLTESVLEYEKQVAEMESRQPAG